MRREIRSARRLGRLFRIECRGGFDRWPVAIIGKLIERRGALAAAVLQMDRRRRAAAVRPTPALKQALAELADELQRALPEAQARLERIGNDLRLSRGEGRPSGIRDRNNGHPLGTT
jgi:hypothetical protein